MGAVSWGGETKGRGLLPEGVETGLGAEVLGLFAGGEHGVYALAHGVVGEPGVGKGLAELVDLWGEPGDVRGGDLGGGAPVLAGGMGGGGAGEGDL